MYTSRKNFHPPGQEVFINALRKLNIPLGLIKNTDLFASKLPFTITSPRAEDDPRGIFFGNIDPPSSQRKRARRPPGATPNVLSVYSTSKK